MRSISTPDATSTAPSSRTRRAARLVAVGATVVAAGGVAIGTLSPSFADTILPGDPATGGSPGAGTGGEPPYAIQIKDLYCYKSLDPTQNPDRFALTGITRSTRVQEDYITATLQREEWDAVKGWYTPVTNFPNTRKDAHSIGSAPTPDQVCTLLTTTGSEVWGHGVVGG